MKNTKIEEKEQKKKDGLLSFIFQGLYRKLAVILIIVVLVLCLLGGIR